MKQIPWLVFILGCILITAIYSYAADKLQTAQEIVQLKKLPLSIPLSFEEAGEQYYDLNFRALLILMELRGDANWNANWNIDNEQWNPTFSAVRQDLGDFFRRNWTQLNEQIIASGYRSERSLASKYAESLTENELDELLNFYRSDIGTKYFGYMESLKRMVAEGQFEAMKIMVDPSLGPRGSSLHDRIQVLQKRGMRDLSSSQPAVKFYTEQAIHASIVSGNMDSLLRLGLGARLLDKKFDDLDQLLIVSEKQQITRFQQSAAAKKERGIIQEWNNTVYANVKIDAILRERHKASSALVEKWQRVVSEQAILKNRVTSDLELEGLKPGLAFDSLPAGEYQCRPSRSHVDVKMCQTVKSGTILGVNVNRGDVGLFVNKNVLYYIRVSLKSNDAPVIIEQLEKNYGAASRKNQDSFGNLTMIWIQTLTRNMVLHHEPKLNNFSVTLVDRSLGDTKVE